MAAFKRVGVIARKDGEAIKETLAAVLAELKRLNIEIALDASSAGLVAPGQAEIVADHAIGENRDLVITIGGDGTLLAAAQKLFLHDVPLTGINLGRVGFLTDLAPDQVSRDLREILNGNLVTEERSFLSCEVIRNGRKLLEVSALNDIVIQKWNTARLITFDTFINDRYAHTQRSDGLIIATPTGSTAYALAGGGPILHPALPALVLVPICPHTLTNRPVVVNDSVRIEIRIATSRADDAQLTCDGNEVFLLAPGDQVRTSKHARSIKLVHPPGHDHFATLRAKLHWGRDLC